MLMTSLLLHVLPDFQIWKMYSPANSQIWKMYYQNLIFLRQKQQYFDFSLFLAGKLSNYLRSVNAQRPTLRATQQPAPWPDEIK